MTITASKSMATPAKTAEQLVHCTAAADAAATAEAAATSATPPPPPSDDAVPAAPPTAAASTPPAPPPLMVSATYFQFTIKQHVPVFLHNNPPTLEQTLATARHGVGLLCLNLTYAMLGTMWLLHGPYAPPDTLSCVQTGCLAAVLYGLALNVLQLSVPNVWLQLADYRKDAHRPREAKAVRRSCMLFVASLGLSCAILASVVFIMYPIVAPLDQMGASWGFVQCIVILLNLGNVYLCCTGYVLSAWLLELQMQLFNPANVLLYSYLKEEHPHVIAVPATRAHRASPALSLAETIV